MSSMVAREEERSTPWRQVSPAQPKKKAGKRRPRGPEPRCGHGVIVNHIAKRLICYGGHTDELRSDVWSFDLASSAWSEVHITSTESPLPRAFFATSAAPFTEDPPSSPGTGYLFGGSDGSVCSNDLWRLTVEDSSAMESASGESSLSGRWENLTPTSAVLPPARANHAMASSAYGLFIHGGEDENLLGDLWFYNLNTSHSTVDIHTDACSNESINAWSPVHIGEGTSPCPRSHHVFGRGEGTNVFMVFGGLTTQAHAAAVDLNEEESTEDMNEDAESLVPLNDLWILTPVDAHTNVHTHTGAHTHTWTWSMLLLDGIGPSPRSQTSACSITCKFTEGEAGDLFFLFGGHGLVELPQDEDEEEPNIITAYIDDLWVLDLKNERWLDESMLGFEGESPIEGRSGHSLSACCDTQLVLYGGFVGDGYDTKVYTADLSDLVERVQQVVVSDDSTCSEDNNDESDRDIES